jgi:hypothetical protein
LFLGSTPLTRLARSRAHPHPQVCEIYCSKFTQSYYNDKHQDAAVIMAREKYIAFLDELMLRQPLWLHLSAKEYAEQPKNLPAPGGLLVHKYSENGAEMYEVHVDLSEKVDREEIPLGGYCSVWLVALACCTFQQSTCLAALCSLLSAVCSHMYVYVCVGGCWSCELVCEGIACALCLVWCVAGGTPVFLITSPLGSRSLSFSGLGLGPRRGPRRALRHLPCAVYAPSCALRRASRPHPAHPRASQ